MPTPAAGNTVASQRRGHAAFDGGCLVLSGTVGPDWVLIPGISFYVCVFEIVS